MKAWFIMLMKLKIIKSINEKSKVDICVDVKFLNNIIKYYVNSTDEYPILFVLPFFTKFDRDSVTSSISIL